MKKIKLTKGKYALVDDKDFKWLNQWKWLANVYKYTTYACRGEYYTKKGVKKRIHLKMHRVILGILDPKAVVDHKDSNGLNNQRSNLRISNHSHNAHVARRKDLCGIDQLSSGNWRAKITFRKKQMHIGVFTTKREALQAFRKRKKEILFLYHNKLI